MGLLSYLAVSHTYPEPSKDEHELEKVEMVVQRTG